MGKKQKPKPQRKRRQQQRQKKKESSRREEGLPVDIVREILVRCPVKTLAKFRCVCKQWGSIISQPSFQEDHHCQNTRASPCVLLTRCDILRGRKKKNTLHFKNILHFSTYTSNGTLVNHFSKTYLHQCSYIPIQSCRGLVCFGSRVRHHPILICNPATMELITLPRTQGINQTVGFGYAASTKEFKVVRFFSVLDDTQICCEVFTLGTSSWREARNHPPQYPPDFFTWGAPFLHGALHMVAHLNSIGNCGGDVLSIEAFDIDKEECKKIPLPEYFHTVKCSLDGMYLKEFKGSLCLIFDMVFCMEIWCLRDYHNREWVNKYSIDLTALRSSAFLVDPLAIMDDGNMMLNIQVKEEALYYYNFRDKSLKKATDMNCWGTLYVESLLHLESSL